jgi:hypothetical protein
MFIEEYGVFVGCHSPGPEPIRWQTLWMPLPHVGRYLFRYNSNVLFEAQLIGTELFIWSAGDYEKVYWLGFPLVADIRYALLKHILKHLPKTKTLDIFRRSIQDVFRTLTPPVTN